MARMPATIPITNASRQGTTMLPLIFPPSLGSGVTLARVRGDRVRSTCRARFLSKERPGRRVATSSYSIAIDHCSPSPPPRARPGRIRRHVDGRQRQRHVLEPALLRRVLGSGPDPRRRRLLSHRHDDARDARAAGAALEGPRELGARRLRARPARPRARSSGWKAGRSTARASGRRASGITTARSTSSRTSTGARRSCSAPRIPPARGRAPR